VSAGLQGGRESLRAIGVEVGLRRGQLRSGGQGLGGYGSRQCLRAGFVEQFPDCGLALLVVPFAEVSVAHLSVRIDEVVGGAWLLWDDWKVLVIRGCWRDSRAWGCVEPWVILGLG